MGQVKKITAAEAKKQMKSGYAVAVDVRTAEEYRERHISGARLLPLNETEERAETVLPDKEAPLLVYCRSGVRSAVAAQKLADLGYQDVSDFGGILDWPYETES